MKKLRLLLLPFSWIYALVMYLRNVLYTRGILSSVSFPVPIISLGNLNTGGTGKTPHTEYILQLLLQTKKVAVLSRGYGRESTGFLEIEKDNSYLIAGDEPLQIKQKFSDAKVFVCESRVTGVRKLLKKYPETEVILLDDAFQHRSLKAGCQLLLTQFNDLFCDDFVLPAGNLREPASGARRAQVIMITKCPPVLSVEDRRKIAEKVRKEKVQKVFFTQLHYLPLRNLFTHKEMPLSEWSLCEIILVTGIAGTHALVSYLKNHSPQIHHLKFSDHHAYCSKDLLLLTEKFNTLANPNKIIIITEKDAVKLSDEKLKNALKDLPVFCLPVQILFHPEEEKLFKELIYEYVGKN